MQPPMSTATEIRRALLGDTYRCELLGDPAGQPVIFLHGFSQSACTWHAVAGELLSAGSGSAPAGTSDPSQRLRLVLPDLVGHGGSDRPERDEPYQVTHVVAALEALRQELGLGPVHLVGYSMGGRAALAYARAYPRALRSLVLESAAFGPRTPAARAEAAARDSALAARLRESSAEEFAEWWAATPVLADQASLPQAQRDEEQAMRSANDTAALARVALGMGQGRMDDLSGVPAGLGVPVLYVCGARDAKYSAIAREVAAPAGCAVVSLAAGHNVHLERPAEYAATLLGFWGRASGHDDDTRRAADE